MILGSIFELKEAHIFPSERNVAGDAENILAGVHSLKGSGKQHTNASRIKREEGGWVSRDTAGVAIRAFEFDGELLRPQNGRLR